MEREQATICLKQPRRFQSSDGRIFEAIDVFDPIKRTWSPFCRLCAEEPAAQTEKDCPGSG